MDIFRIGAELMKKRISYDILDTIYQFCGDKKTMVPVPQSNNDDCYIGIMVTLTEDYEYMYYCLQCDTMLMATEFDEHYEKPEHIKKLANFDSLLKHCSFSEKISLIEQIVTCNMEMNMYDFVQFIDKIHTFSLH